MSAILSNGHRLGAEVPERLDHDTVEDDPGRIEALHGNEDLGPSLPDVNPVVRSDVDLGQRIAPVFEMRWTSRNSPSPGGSFTRKRTPPKSPRRPGFASIHPPY